jgi:hypothetical protein
LLCHRRVTVLTDVVRSQLKELVAGPISHPEVQAEARGEEQRPHTAGEGPVTGDLPGKVDAVDSAAAKQIDIELAILADCDADGAARDRVLGGVGYSRSNPLVLPHVALADRLREQIITGRIKVPVKP